MREGESAAPVAATAAGEPVVELHGLRKSYGTVRALDGLTLALPPGPVGLLGPNGAGKTTLIKLLLGLLEPDGGRGAHRRPRPDDAARERLALRRAVGYMPESDCLIPRHERGRARRRRSGG